jgi:hypothetical protein
MVRDNRPLSGTRGRSANRTELLQAILGTRWAGTVALPCPSLHQVELNHHDRRSHPSAAIGPNGNRRGPMPCGDLGLMRGCRLARFGRLRPPLLP